MESSDFHVCVGQEVSFSKTVSESDVYLFAGITGDFFANHVNEAAMRRSKYKHRIAHGALLVGFMSTGSTRMIETFGAAALDRVTPVSLGYDRVRFLAAVYFGDTITLRYRITRVDPDRSRSYAEIRITNQDGTEVAAAQHIMKWVPNDPPLSPTQDGPRASR